MLEFKIEDGENFPLTPGKLCLIGRKTIKNAGPRISLSDDKSFEYKHAILEIENETAYIVDLQSDAGTFLNGRRLEALIRVKITVNDSLRFGLHVNAKLHTNPSDAEKSHDSSGFHDGHKNTSDVIESSPEVSTKGQSRRANFKNAFLVPAAPFSRSKNAKVTNGGTSFSLNSSTNSTGEADFPEIPETQYFCKQHHSRGSANVSVADSDCFNKTDASEADLFIPETQEAPNRFQANNAIVDANLSASQCAPGGSSQFRICTQLFNEDCCVDINSNSESDEFDLLDEFQRNNEAGKVKQPVKTAMRKEDDDEEMCALNWSAPTSKNTTLNVLRDDASTPDLCDFPEEQQDKIRQILNTSSSSFTAPKAAAITKPTNIKLAEPFPPDEEEDLMPTQVFIRKPVDKKPLIEDKQQLDKAESGYLTLSGKENLESKVAAAILEVRNEILTKIEASSTNSVNVVPIKSTASTNDTTESKTMQDYNFDDFAPTQIFPTSKPTKAAQQTNVSAADETKNCFKSILLVKDEKLNMKKATSSFKDFEEPSTKAAIMQIGDTFKKPEPGALFKTISSTSSAASLIEPPTFLEPDMLMCTPIFLREKFVDSSAAVVKQSLIAAKQKNLFGDDSDEEKEKEEEDILKLINAPKTSKDFDILQPKEKSFNCSYKKTISAKQEEIKANKVHRLFDSNTLKGDQQATNQKRSRDERHSARDKKRPMDKEKSNTTGAKGTIASSISTRKRKTSSTLESATEAKIQKVDPTKTKVKEVKRMVKTNSKTHEQDPKEDQSVNDVSKTELNEKQINLPNRRMTRLLSRTAATEEAVEVKAKAVSRSTKGRSTRMRLSSDSKESGSRPSVTTSESANEAKGKIQKQPTKEPTRLQSMSSQDDSTAIDSNKSTKLKVTMTMVDPKRFEQLAKTSSGKWTIAKDPVDSDILIMDKANRTFKFLLAIARGIPIVTSNWLECVNSSNTKNMAEHIFADAAYEKRHKFTISNSLEKARKHRLFAGYEFLMTPGIQPKPEEMKAIIKCAGGKVHTDTPLPVDKGADAQKLYLISSAHEKQHWHKYRRVNNNIRIISSEGVMSSVMRQQVEPLDKFLLSY